MSLPSSSIPRTEKALCAAEASLAAGHLLGALRQLDDLEKHGAPLTGDRLARASLLRIQARWLGGVGLEISAEDPTEADSHPLTRFNEAMVELAWGQVALAQTRLRSLAMATFVDRAALDFALGRCGSRRGDDELARVHFTAAAMRWNMDSDHLSAAHCEEELARIELSRDAPNAAAVRLEACLAQEVWKSLAPPSLEADLLDSLGVARSRAGQAEDAIMAFKASLSLRRERLWSTHPDIRRSLGALARLLGSVGREDEARVFGLELHALEIQAAGLAPDPSVLSTYESDVLAASLKKFGAHVAGFVGPLESASTGGLIFLRPRTDGLEREWWRYGGGDNQDTSEAFQPQRVRSAGSSPRQRAKDLLREHRQLVEGQLKLGIHLNDRAMLALQASRLHSLDRLLSYTLLGEVPAEPAFEAVAHGRHLLLDEFRSRSQRLQGGDEGARALGRECLAAEATLLQTVHKANPELDPPQRAVLCRRARLRRDRIAQRLLATLAHETEPALASHTDAGLLRASLAPDEALLSIVRFRCLPSSRPGSSLRESVPVYIAFLLIPERPVEMILLGLADEIDERCRDWRRQIRRGAEGFSFTRAWLDRLQTVSGEQVRELVWEPIIAKVPDVTRLFVVSDGRLATLPWEALPRRDGGFLIEDGPSIERLALEQDLLVDSGEMRFDGLLALSGYSESGAVDLPRLAHSLAELRHLEMLWGRARQKGQVNGQSRCLSGSTANRQALVEGAENAGLLHVIGHGLHYDGPLETDGAAAGSLDDLPLARLAIALAPGENGGQRVGALELAALPLGGCRLVVLSACDTARGEHMDGLGVIGLQRACRMAGASSVLVSLWPVADDMAARWMARFHEGLLEDGLSPAAAARQASRLLLAELRDQGRSDSPANWAAFVCQGRRED